MKTDLSTLTATILANHLAIKFPRNPAIAELEWDDRRLKYALAVDGMVMRSHRSFIRTGLAEAGHWQFIDRLTTADDGDWLLDLFFYDDNAMPLVAGMTEGTICRDASPKPAVKKFVEHRLGVLARRNRLSGRYLWWDDA